MRSRTLAWAVALLALSSAPGVGQGVLPGSDARPIACAYNTSLPTLFAGQLGIAQCDSSGRLLISGGSGTSQVNDPQNAPYGQATATPGVALTPGGAAGTPARNIHIFCAPTTSPATGYTTLTEANGETHQVQLATGAQYDFPWAVTQVAAQTTVTGTLAACEFKNMN